MIKLTDLLLEMASDSFEYAYHAGPHKLTVKTIIFDRASLGFHVGTMDQAQWVSSGKTGKGVVKNGLPISKFKVFETAGNLDMTTIEHDMSWEHVDILLVELVHEGEINPEDAHNLIESWEDVTWDQIKELHELIDEANKKWGNTNFVPISSFRDGFSLESNIYKNREKLSQIRNMLVKTYNIGAIKYKNQVEGDETGYSFCILDKSMIKDA